MHVYIRTSVCMHVYVDSSISGMHPMRIDNACRCVATSPAKDSCDGTGPQSCWLEELGSQAVAAALQRPTTAAPELCSEVPEPKTTVPVRDDEEQIFQAHALQEPLDCRMARTLLATAGLRRPGVGRQHLAACSRILVVLALQVHLLLYVV